MRLIDADALRGTYVNRMSEICKNVASMKNVEVETVSVLCGYSVIDEVPTICCESCKHGIRGECIGGREYFGCIKPYAGLSNYHTKDWVCGDWKGKDAID